MRWGLGLYTGQVPPGADHDAHDELGRIVEQAKLADRLGIDSLWLSEHHGTEDGYLPSLLTVAAAVLASTERLIVGTGVLLAPFHNPLRLAEDVAVLDQLSGGRFILGLGTGWRAPELRSFGIRPEDRVPALEETVAVLRRAWTGERFDHDGRLHRFDGALVRPRPYTEGGPPIWLGGTGPKALARAGRLGDGHIGVGVPFDDAVGAFDAARAAASDPARFSFGQMRTGFIAADADAALTAAGEGMAYTMRTHAAWAAQDAGEDVAHAGVDVDTDAVRAYNVLGTANEVGSVLRPYAERFASRDDCHLCFRLYHPFTPYDDVLAAIESYGTDVVPTLRAAERRGAAA